LKIIVCVKCGASRTSPPTNNNFVFSLSHEDFYIFRLVGGDVLDAPKKRTILLNLTPINTNLSVFCCDEIKPPTEWSGALLF